MITYGNYPVLNSTALRIHWLQAGTLKAQYYVKHAMTGDVGSRGALAADLGSEPLRREDLSQWRVRIVAICFTDPLTSSEHKLIQRLHARILDVCCIPEVRAVKQEGKKE